MKKSSSRPAPSYHRIETAEDFLRWAKDVNHQLYDRCDMQDVYAHSSRNLLDRLFVESSDRKLLLCSIYNTMAYEEVEHMLKVRAIDYAEKAVAEEYAECDKRLAEVKDREQQFKDSMKPYHKRLADLRAENAKLSQRTAVAEDANHALHVELRWLREELRMAQAKAAKYDAIKSALNI